MIVRFHEESGERESPAIVRMCEVGIVETVVKNSVNTRATGNSFV